MANEYITYEESVRWMRSQPEHTELVKLCYLDEDNLTAAKRFASSEEFAEIADILGLRDSGRKLKILDLGCGNGIASYAFASLGHDVSAVDPDNSEDVGLGATARLSVAITNGSIITHKAFAESLPFPDSMFDVVYARQALHHFSDLQKGLMECSRVLKPGGFLLATREHVVDDEQQLQAFFENHMLHKWHGGENAYPVERYISALKQAGLKVTKCFAPFDTVINYFPISDSDVKEKIYGALQESYGRLGASLLIRIPPVKKAYTHRVSLSDHYPGRLFSFLCTKGKNN